MQICMDMSFLQWNFDILMVSIEARLFYHRTISISIQTGILILVKLHLFSVPMLASSGRDTHIHNLSSKLLISQPFFDGPMVRPIPPPPDPHAQGIPAQSRRPIPMPPSLQGHVPKNTLKQGKEDLLSTQSASLPSESADPAIPDP